MENKLKKLFDYQRFEQNERLEKLIWETEGRYTKELSDDDLTLVNAAGEITMNPVAIGENAAANGGGIYHGGSAGLDGKSVNPIGSGGGGGGGGAGGGSGAAMSN